MFAKLKERIKTSREEGAIRRLREKLGHDCEHCPCAWEDRSYEGDCDCGCLLYRDMDARHLGCLLPDRVLRIYAKGRLASLAEQEAKSYEGIAEWYETSETKDRLFRQAMSEKLFTDWSGNPVAPLRKDKDGNFHSYAPRDAFALARMDYETNLDAPMPRIKAFQKAIAERLETDLYFRSGDQYESIRIFANSGNAVERYHGLLLEHGIET